MPVVCCCKSIMTNRILLGVAQVALGTILVLCLYVYSATASISDEYSPGMSAFRLRLHPLSLIGCFVGVPMVVGLLDPVGWRSASPWADRLGTTAAGVFLGVPMVVGQLDPVGWRSASQWADPRATTASAVSIVFLIGLVVADVVGV